MTTDRKSIQDILPVNAQKTISQINRQRGTLRKTKVLHIRRTCSGAGFNHGFLHVFCPLHRFFASNGLKKKACSGRPFSYHPTGYWSMQVMVIEHVVPLSDWLQAHLKTPLPSTVLTWQQLFPEQVMLTLSQGSSIRPLLSPMAW